MGGAGGEGGERSVCLCNAFIDCTSSLEANNHAFFVFFLLSKLHQFTKLRMINEE